MSDRMGEQVARNADWWCWTDGEPSTFRCRERGHDVQPARPPWVSTSAELRQTQQALAASQADLTRVERERDLANDLTDKIASELRLVTRERDSLARRCAIRFQEAQALSAELATARQELDRLRKDSPPGRAGPREDN